MHITFLLIKCVPFHGEQLSHRYEVEFKIYNKCYQIQNLKKYKIKNEYYCTILNILLAYKSYNVLYLNILQKLSNLEIKESF